MGIEKSKEKAVEYCEQAVRALSELAENETKINKSEQYFLQKTAKDMAYRVY